MAKIERIEGVFLVRAPAAHLRIRAFPRPVTLGLARERLQRECIPRALCIGSMDGALFLDDKDGSSEPAAKHMERLGGTVSVWRGRVVVGDGCAVLPQADVAIHGAPLLVDDALAVPQSPNTKIAWRSAVVAFSPAEAGFAVCHATLADFAVRLARAGASWAAHGMAGDSVRIMDEEGNWRGSPVNRPCGRVWYVAPPKWEDKIGVRSLGDTARN